MLFEGQCVVCVGLCSLHTVSLTLNRMLPVTGAHICFPSHTVKAKYPHLLPNKHTHTPSSCNASSPSEQTERVTVSLWRQFKERYSTVEVMNQRREEKKERRWRLRLAEKLPVILIITLVVACWDQSVFSGGSFLGANSRLEFDWSRRPRGFTSCQHRRRGRCAANWRGGAFGMQTLKQHGVLLLTFSENVFLQFHTFIYNRA